MARAQIKINGTDSRFTAVAIGVAVNLSNDDNGGESTYAWTLVDQPEGTADALSATNVRDVTLTPTKEGSYELLLTVNGTLTQTAIVAVLDARTGERIPAATETTESGTAEGWALALKPILARVLHASVDGNVVVARTPGGIAAGTIVSLTATATINAGTQAAFGVTSIAAALGTTTHRDRLGILVDGVTPGSLGADSLVLVRMFGLVAASGAGSPAVGDPVYLSDAGLPALAPGTVTRRIGHVVSSSAGAYQWLIDSVDAFSAPAGTLLAVQKITASGTYTPTPGTTLTIFEPSGGGGAGGSVAGGGTGAAAAGGGASGTTIRITVANPVVGAVTIGAGGTPGAAGNNVGGNGGDTTIVQGVTTYIAKGGGGGGGMANQTAGTVIAAGGAPLAGSTATGWFAAEIGQRGRFYAGSTWESGSGGGGARGIGGFGQIGAIAAAAAGSGYGAGGAGAAATTTSAQGAAGTIGVLFAYDYA